MPEKKVSTFGFTSSNSFPIPQIWSKYYLFSLAKANQDQTSVRSHSPDIADDINREIAETGMRLANMANSSNPDTSMDPATMSLNRGDTESQRSQSSEGSLNKRTMKSNIALQNKKSAIQKMQGKYRSDPFKNNFFYFSWSRCRGWRGARGRGAKLRLESDLHQISNGHIGWYGLGDLR